MKPETLEIIRLYGDIFFCTDAFVNSVLATLDSIDINEHIKHVESRGSVDSGKETELETNGYINSRGVAEISLEGPVTKKPTSMSDLFGGFSTIQAEKAISNAIKDDRVKSLLLKIDSPGGSVNGVQSLADRIYAADKIKPICVYADDLMCSAGYWIGSQGRFLASNETALLANIGGYIAVTDYSKAADERGVKVKVIKKGEFKAIGYPGTSLTTSQEEELQRMVDNQVALFTYAVSRGRNIPISKAELLTDGRIYVGNEAIGKGLLDSIMSYDTLLNAMQNDITDSGELKQLSASNKEKIDMGNEVVEVKHAVGNRLLAALGISVSGETEEKPNSIIQVHPLVAKAEELGIKTVEDLTKVHAQSLLSEELQAEYRAQACANAIRAYGQLEAVSQVELINSAETPFKVVKLMNESFVKLIKTQFDPQSRNTKPLGDGAEDINPGSAEFNEEQYKAALASTSLGQTILDKQNGEGGKKKRSFWGE